MDRSMLARATSSDDAPCPGYLYGEISKMTSQSYEVSQKVQAYLLDRLTKKNHNVKFKVLNVIKQVCRAGRPDFKRDMQRNTAPVKECLQFRGPPDPLRGDEIYKRVRDAAKECMDAIFDTSTAPASTASSGIGSRIRGMGGGEGSSEGGGGGYSGGGGSGYSGASGGGGGGGGGYTYG